MYQLHPTHGQLRFSKSCLSTCGLLSSCPKSKKLLALLLVLEVCEVVTPSPNKVWKGRRGSESNRRLVSEFNRESVKLKNLRCFAEQKEHNGRFVRRKHFSQAVCHNLPTIRQFFDLWRFQWKLIKKAFLRVLTGSSYCSGARGGKAQKKRVLNRFPFKCFRRNCRIPSGWDDCAKASNLNHPDRRQSPKKGNECFGIDQT